MSQLVTVKGTVTEFAWDNPHPMITLEVRTDDGKTEKWLVGGPAINRMEANGWTKTTVKPGDVITGTGCACGGRGMWRSIRAATAVPADVARGIG